MSDRLKAKFVHVKVKVEAPKHIRPTTPPPTPKETFASKFCRHFVLLLDPHFARLSEMKWRLEMKNEQLWLTLQRPFSAIHFHHHKMWRNRQNGISFHFVWIFWFCPKGKKHEIAKLCGISPALAQRVFKVVSCSKISFWAKKDQICIHKDCLPMPEFFLYIYECTEERGQQDRPAWWCNLLDKFRSRCGKCI